ncbi:MAG TPA: DUF1214 domain-containing protein [Candidatus Acidoferrales bacterium]|nr:DUF1214 domain-containing protein [Candidatus Acidoferrales bacterium]
MSPDTATTQSLSPAELERRTIERRAVEVAIRGIPIVAIDAIRQGFLRDMQARLNDIVYYRLLPDWKFQTTTPNASTHYFYSAHSTKDGPMVLDVPAAVGAGIYGQVCDIWDVPLAIVGPGGDDKGKGGKYLLLPPDYKDPLPAGCLPVRQQTYGGFWLMRTIPKSAAQADVDSAISLIKKFRMHALSQSNDPPEQRFIDASGKLWDGVPHMDESFYAVLAKVVNEEPVLERDLAVMNMLRSVGIEKGKGFNPDAATSAILRDAVKEAQAWFVNRLRLTAASTPYWEGGRWSLPDATGMKTQFSYQSAEMLDYDGRGMLNYAAWGPPMKQDKDAPSIYLQAYSDSTGQPLTGDSVYRLRVPANAPAKQYWSVTVYDLETEAFIREAAVVSLDSYNQKTRKNADGSVDIYFAPHAPPGQEDNWVTTAKGRPWNPLFRLYGPEKAFFDKTWRLPDFERLATK